MPNSLYFQVISKKYLTGIVEKASENHNFWGNISFTPICHPKAVNDNDKFPRISWQNKSSRFEKER